MKWSWRSELPVLLLLAFIWIMALSQWNALPDRLPVHWGVAGQPNRYGGRAEALLLLPAIATFVSLVLALAPALDPSRLDAASLGGAYLVVRIAVLAFFAAIQGVLLAIYRGAHVDLMGVILPLIGLLFIVLGGVVGRLRRNAVAGIRTPWTLSSERAWTRTHRAAGPVLAANGVVWIVAGLSHSVGGVLIAVVALFGSTIALAVYSRLVWARDEERG